MKNTDTPETDAARAEYQKAMWTGKTLPSQEMVPITFARKLERDKNKWKKAIIPFLAVHAAQYGKERFGEGCMIDSHYDLLKEAGARMDDFTRCDTSSLENAKGKVSPE